MEKLKKMSKELSNEIIISLGSFKYDINNKMLDLAYDIQHELQKMEKESSEPPKKLDYDVHIS